MAVKAVGSVTVASINDVASTTRYYLLQASTLTAPAKPTASPPGGSWAATEPTYTDGSTNSLYTCDETIFSDGTWAYSDVSLSTSYEAAKAAYNKANAASSTAGAAQKAADGAKSAAATAQTSADRAQAQATQTAETLAQAQEYLDGIRQWVSDGQSFLGFQDVGEATAQLTIANRDSSFYTTLTNTRQEYRNGSSTIMAIDGQHGRVEASALAVGSYVWQATNGGANMTLAYIGG